MRLSCFISSGFVLRFALLGPVSLLLVSLPPHCYLGGRKVGREEREGREEGRERGGRRKRGREEGRERGERRKRGREERK